MSLYAIWDNLFSFLVKVNQNLKFLHWASILIGNLQSIPASFKWESPWANCADHTAIKFLSPMKQLVAQVIVALVVEHWVP